MTAVSCTAMTYTIYHFLKNNPDVHLSRELKQVRGDVSLCPAWACVGAAPLRACMHACSAHLRPAPPHPHGHPRTVSSPCPLTCAAPHPPPRLQDELAESQRWREQASVVQRSFFRWLAETRDRAVSHPGGHSLSLGATDSRPLCKPSPC